MSIVSTDLEELMDRVKDMEEWLPMLYTAYEAIQDAESSTPCGFHFAHNADDQIWECIQEVENKLQQIQDKMEAL